MGRNKINTPRPREFFAMRVTIGPQSGMIFLAGAASSV
ncbi:hypothetical protein MA5S0422_3021 [Mycobacteroides abscessus 5S-0422]|uniref:Uncharacterized protein n=1 Tax=Mycobacteroides abscessus subsp. bolletii 1513 TaxID=1299321 RepID=X8DSD8_9MYCO|nr:hypothetical protein MA5S0421_2342 [Mycobacteroides abscessus 5S-0421]EIU09065.1 hypothetical protein MA5S0304_2088 [Mycobacteroides abscessus 5S-0304]EIU13312.1 hypothetical protein MA5S0422_3021 [Mycobacteroides abscessus 5S-0422]EIU22635.1 hypothetical protein MA5S0708_5110 [Mycobacteroides abscessus 5S-0708]EIU26678.1 hypothetical protein MA5S0817_1634 [Mycobacteroides abscessus 5S-0817]EIU30925.1 hypothetical protein MA5S1212_4330 [Mycobacteroides abscessus 5S-1212]EIU43508.1 hypothet